MWWPWTTILGGGIAQDHGEGGRARRGRQGPRRRGQGLDQGDGGGSESVSEKFDLNRTLLLEKIGLTLVLDKWEELYIMVAEICLMPCLLIKNIFFWVDLIKGRVHSKIKVSQNLGF